MTFEERVQSRQLVYQGGLVQVERQEVTLPDQTTATREIVRHQPAVAMLMITAQHKMIVEQQWRAATGGLTVEIPAGKVESGETMDQAAEQIRLIKLDLATAVSQVQTGQIQDAKTVMAIWYWQSHPELGVEA